MDVDLCPEHLLLIDCTRSDTYYTPVRCGPRQSKGGKQCQEGLCLCFQGFLDSQGAFSEAIAQ